MRSTELITGGAESRRRLTANQGIASNRLAVAETAGTASIRMINANLTIEKFPLARMTKVSFHHNRAYHLLM